MIGGIHFFAQAAEEVEAELRWYAERSPAAEQMLLREIEHAISIVASAPDLWPEYLAGTQRYMLRTFPFSLIYFQEGEAILVVAFAHHRRRPGYWRRRISSPPNLEVHE
jgi:hypothetical protein